MQGEQRSRNANTRRALWLVPALGVLFAGWVGMCWWLVGYL